MNTVWVSCTSADGGCPEHRQGAGEISHSANNVRAWSGRVALKVSVLMGYIRRETSQISSGPGVGGDWWRGEFLSGPRGVRKRVGGVQLLTEKTVSEVGAFQ